MFEQNVIRYRSGISDLMPLVVYRISKRYTVCLLCLHCKIYYFLPKCDLWLEKCSNSKS